MFFSAHYHNFKTNFCIQNITGDDDTSSPYYSIFCVVKNLLNRGMPSTPSVYLRSKIPYISVSSDLYLESFNAQNKKIPQWLDTIKGEEDSSYNPALDFWNKTLPENLRGWQFVQKSILPETPCEWIFQGDHRFKDQAVDFYSLLFRFVIEIDGSQHKEDVQTQKDLSRDKALNQKNIKVFRIEVSDLENNSDILHSKIEELIRHLQSTQLAPFLKQSKQILSDNPNIINYEIVMRFQMLLISLLQKGKISLTEKIWVFGVEEQYRDLFEIAWEDTYLWIKHLCNLAELECSKPNIQFDEEGILIDLSLDMPWTDENQFNQNTIFIRNHYFSGNLFEVATAELIPYKIELQSLSHKDSLIFFLENLFEYNTFNAGQIPIIINALNGRNTLGLLPTGSGKSLCYHMACLLQPCISFIIEPIVSLMLDQKDNLDRMGIVQSQFISSEKSITEKKAIAQDFFNCKHFMIWVSPERFQSPDFLEELDKYRVKGRKVAYAVIDEAHCLSEWGHDFRIAYLTLTRTLRDRCPDILLLGLTATASNFVLNDLKKEMEIDSIDIKTTASMDRPELEFFVKTTVGNREQELFNILDEQKKIHNRDIFKIDNENPICGLAFTPHKNGELGCNTLASTISNYIGTHIKAYSGDLNSKEKEIVQREFISDRFPMITATKAFGMGINKRNIRYTIHYGMPASVEAFYQEAGRAGRDADKSLKSHCYIIYRPETNKQNLHKIFSNNTPVEQLTQLKGRSDIYKQLYFFTDSHKGISVEKDHILRVFNYLSQEDTGNVLPCANVNLTKPDAEKSLYRLAILGFIKSWITHSWDFHDALFECVKLQPKLEDIRQNLVNYFKRYDPLFDIQDTDRYKEYSVLLSDETLSVDSLITALLEWTYSNIVNQRRQAIKNIMDACEEYTDSNAFRARLNAFFDLVEAPALFDTIAENPLDYESWIKAIDFDSAIKDSSLEKELEKRLFSLQRYLESYHHNPGIDFLTGVFQLVRGTYNEEERRLESGLDELFRREGAPVEDIVEKALQIVSYAQEPMKEKFSQHILTRWPQFARSIHEKLKDDESLSYILQDLRHNINIYKGKMNGISKKN